MILCPQKVIHGQELPSVAVSKNETINIESKESKVSSDFVEKTPPGKLTTEIAITEIHKEESKFSMVQNDGRYLQMR